MRNPSFEANYLQSVAEVLQGDERIGLGFFVRPRILATCAHVVRDAGADVRVRVPGAEHLVRVVLDEPQHDLAFLQLDVPVSGFEIAPLELATEPPALGAQVHFVGYASEKADAGPLREGARLVTGQLQSIARATRPGAMLPGEFYVLDADAAPGFSGGPVVVAGTRRVGAMVFARDATSDRALALPVSVIETCLRRLVAMTGSPPRPVGLHTPGGPGGRYRFDHHIARPALDARVMALFDARSPIVLCAPTLSGKTWWLNHLLPQFEAALGPHGCVVSMQSSVFARHAPFKDMLFSIASAMVRGIRGDAKSARQGWDDDLLPSVAMDTIVEDHFLRRFSGEALLVLDLPDEFWDNQAQGDFFGLLRSWSQQSGDWDRLRLLVAYSSTPSVWTGNPADSPFNVLPVIIDDWSPSEVLQMASRYEVGAAPAVVERLMGQIGGHPYLVRGFLHHVRDTGRDLARAVDDLSLDISPFLPLLQVPLQRARILENPQTVALLHDVSEGRKLDMVQYRRLYDAGLVTGTAAAPRLRVPIMRRLLAGS